jgi:hypothetical protein
MFVKPDSEHRHRLPAGQPKAAWRAVLVAGRPRPGPTSRRRQHFVLSAPMAGAEGTFGDDIPALRLGVGVAVTALRLITTSESRRCQVVSQHLARAAPWNELCWPPARSSCRQWPGERASTGVPAGSGRDFSHGDVWAGRGFRGAALFASCGVQGRDGTPGAAVSLSCARLSIAFWGLHLSGTSGMGTGRLSTS